MWKYLDIGVDVGRYSARADEGLAVIVCTAEIDDVLPFPVQCPDLVDHVNPLEDFAMPSVNDIGKSAARRLARGVVLRLDRLTVYACPYVS